MMMMQPSSHNNENRKNLQASSPLRNIKETRASGTGKETRAQGAEKESEAHSHVRLPLEMERLLSPNIS